MNKKELKTASVRRFERQLLAARRGDDDLYMILMAKYFKRMDDKSMTDNARDFELFTALAEKVSKGIFDFDIEEAYRREMSRQNNSQKKRKKFPRK